MKCLQCNKDAQETGEMSYGVTLRQCEDGHRTGKATAAMNKAYAAWKRENLKAKKEGLIDFDAMTPAEQERQEEVNAIVKRGAQKAV